MMRYPVCPRVPLFQFVLVALVFGSLNPYFVLFDVTVGRLMISVFGTKRHHETSVHEGQAHILSAQLVPDYKQYIIHRPHEWRWRLERLVLSIPLDKVSG